MPTHAINYRKKPKSYYRDHYKRNRGRVLESQRIYRARKEREGVTIELCQNVNGVLVKLATW